MLQRKLSLTEEMVSEGVNIYVNVNNHYEGSAPLSIHRLLEFMGEEWVGACGAGPDTDADTARSPGPAGSIFRRGGG